MLQESSGTDFACNICVPIRTGTTYAPILENGIDQKGIYLSSHRNVFRYQHLDSIPPKPLRRNEAFTKYDAYMKKEYSGKRVYVDKDGATYNIKETLISWAAFGYGNQVVQRDDNAVRWYEEFQDILRRVLPPSIGFKGFEIDLPEVVLKTDSGDFSLDAVSGGMAALIEICWQIFMYGEISEEYTVIIDEPENHLHPELQRSLIPSLLDAFPRIQFIVATHNPFIIGSAEQSKVYVLNYDDDHKVVSHLLNDLNKAGTANDILRQALGIPVTMPSWAEHKLEEIVSRYSNKEITEENINSMKTELKGVGLDDMIPDSVVRVITNQERNNT